MMSIRFVNEFPTIEGIVYGKQSNWFLLVDWSLRSSPVSRHVQDPISPILTTRPSFLLRPLFLGVRSFHRILCLIWFFPLKNNKKITHISAGSTGVRSTDVNTHPLNSFFSTNPAYTPCPEHVSTPENVIFCYVSLAVLRSIKTIRLIISVSPTGTDMCSVKRVRTV